MATVSIENPVPDLVFENVQDDETIHQVCTCQRSSRSCLIHRMQRCVIIKAHYSPIANSPSIVTIHQKTATGDEAYPPQTWPVAEGQVKIIAMLAPGLNMLHINPNSDATQVNKLTLFYAPLLRQPPLHLAIMVAKDSDLEIDYEPSKTRPGLDNKSLVDTAINRFRMTAYMWQAMIAEDMRVKGLGRRSFRLDEDWGIDTTSARFINALRQADIWEAGAARLTAKVHVITSDHTMAEIKNPKIAQDNPLGKNKRRLHDWFAEALQASGLGIFTSSARPIVAGLIIDSEWIEESMFVQGHTAMGSHNATGTSLCVMGSHLVYSWPEHLEEINSFLVDASGPDFGFVSIPDTDTVTMWEICSVGQTNFLHQLGHAFGAFHTTGIMKGDCAQHWPRHFVARTAIDRVTGEEGIVVDAKTANEATFDIKDLLAFSHLPHFWMPGDRRPLDPRLSRYTMPSVRAEEIENEDGDVETHIVASSPANIVRVLWNDEASETPSLSHQLSEANIPIWQVEQAFSRDMPVRFAVLAGNGKERIVPNIWDLVTEPSTLRIPGSDVVLHRQSVMCQDLEQGLAHMEIATLWRWATLLSKPMEHGTIVRANEINIRVGCNLLGLYVRFEDGIRVNCGPRFHKLMKTTGARFENQKFKKHFGGHIHEDLMISPSHEVVRVEVGRDSKVLRGVKIHLSNGEVKGALCGGGRFEELCVLGMGLTSFSSSTSIVFNRIWLTIGSSEPPQGERVVGFYGRSYFGKELDGMVEFGIITAPRDVELPVQVYDMPDVQNTDGGLTVSEPYPASLGHIADLK